MITHDERSATVYLRPQDESLAKAELSLCPTLVDSGFHGLFALLQSVPGVPEKTSFLPIRIGSLRLLQPEAMPEAVRIKVTKASPRSIEATFEYIDTNGAVIARLARTRFRAVKLGRETRPNELIYKQPGHALARRRPQSSGRSGFCRMDLQPLPDRSALRLTKRRNLKIPYFSSRLWDGRLPTKRSGNSARMAGST